MGERFRHPACDDNDDVDHDDHNDDGAADNGPAHDERTIHGPPDDCAAGLTPGRGLRQIATAKFCWLSPVKNAAGARRLNSLYWSRT